MAALEPIIASLPYFTQVLVRPRLEEGIALPRRTSVDLSDASASHVAVTGTLTVLLSTERDGRTLHVDATMRSERLTVPVVVRSDYVRAP